MELASTARTSQGLAEGALGSVLASTRDVLATLTFFSELRVQMDDAIAVDVLLPTRNLPQFALPRGEIQSYIVVSRETFDEDLLRSFSSRERMSAIKNQVFIDSPRCCIEVDGVRTKSIPPIADARKLALCTQAVLGLPVELLHRSVGLVMEPQCCEVDKGLIIKVSNDGDFTAHKRLVVFTNGVRHPVVLFLVGRKDEVYMHVVPDAGASL